MRAHLLNVEDVIESEIKLGATQHDIAKTYALGLVSDWPTNWARVNAAIRARWPKGLSRIKQLAWSGKAFSREAE